MAAWFQYALDLVHRRLHEIEWYVMQGFEHESDIDRFIIQRYLLCAGKLESHIRQISYLQVLVVRDLIDFKRGNPATTASGGNITCDLGTAAAELQDMFIIES